MRISFIMGNKTKKKLVISMRRYQEDRYSEVIHARPINENATGPVSTWMRSMWRPLAAMVYLAICVFDFIIAPYFVQAAPINLAEVFTYILKLPVDQRVDALGLLITKQSWTALTLQGGGLFHIAFGAILGASAWTRGMEKSRRIELTAGGFSHPSYQDHSYYDNDQVSPVKPKRKPGGKRMINKPKIAPLDT